MTINIPLWLFIVIIWFIATVIAMIVTDITLSIINKRKIKKLEDRNKDEGL